MKRMIVLVGVSVSMAVVATVIAAGFAASETPPRTQLGVAESAQAMVDVTAHTKDLETRVVRLQERTDRLESALRRSEETTALLSKKVKEIAEVQDRFARAIAVDASGGVRISGNLRLDGNVLEDTTTVDCDNQSTGSSRRQCTCPDGRIATGIELRPIAVSAMPGPSTYNTALVCSRI